MSHRVKSSVLFFSVLLIMSVIVVSCNVGDDTPPGTIQDLSFDSATRQLRWSSPGDDGDSGVATIYDLRFSRNLEVIRDNFSNATQVMNEPGPRSAGSPQSFSIPRLDTTGTENFFFALSARDEVGSMSSPSNIVQAQAPLVSVELSDDAPESCFGQSVGVGDFNGDNVNDIAVGDSCLGRVQVFFAPNILADRDNDDDDDDDGIFDTEPDVAIIGDPGEMFGASVATIGNIAGDFANDLAISSPGFDGGRGRVFIIFGGSDFLDRLEDTEIIDFTGADQPDILIAGENSGDAFGSAIAGLTSVESGNRAAALIGAPGAESQRGKAYLFRENEIEEITSAGDSRVEEFIGESAGDMFGFSLTRTGDFDDDAFSDFAVGAPGAGRAYVFFGQSEVSGRDLSAGTSGIVILESADDDDEFGFSVSGGVDVDDEDPDEPDEIERPDLLIGAPGSDTDAGSAFFYTGADIGSARNTGISPDFTTELIGENPGDRFGTSVGILADVNPGITRERVDEGFIFVPDPTNADLAVGAPEAAGGAVYLFFGRSDLPDSISAGNARVILDGDSSSQGFGTVLERLGDVSGDLINDFVAGGLGFARVEF